MKRVMSGWYGWYYRYSVTIPLLFRQKERASDDDKRNDGDVPLVAIR